MEEESKQLNEVIMNITIFFLHSNDVWWVIGLLFVHFQILIEGEKAELEEVFDDDGNLKEQVSATFTHQEQLKYNSVHYISKSLKSYLLH